MRRFGGYGTELAVLAVAAIVPFTPLVDRAPAGVLLRGLGGFAVAILPSAIAIVLVYRTHRFLHLAQLSMAAFCATLFTGLVNGAPLLRILRAACHPCIGPEPGTLAVAINFWLASGITLAIGVSGAALLHHTLLRRFSGAPRLVPTLATLFLGQALLAVQSTVFDKLIPVAATETESAGADATARALEEFGGPVTAPFGFTLDVGDIAITHVEMLGVALAVLLPIAIGIHLRRASGGVAIRAATEDSERAATLGIDAPAVTTRVWMLVGGLAAVSGMLIAYAQGTPVAAAGDGRIAGATLAGSLVLALAIAVVARMRSLPVAVAAGLVFALIHTAVTWSSGSSAPFDAALGLVVAALLLLGRRAPGRPTRERPAPLELAREPRPVPPELRALPSVRSWGRTGAVMVAALALGVPLVATSGQTQLAATALVTAISGLSLLVLTGWAGQISLGQWGFAAVGAWAAAVSGLPLPPALVVAALAGAIASVVIGYPALRLEGLELGVATLAFAFSAGLVLTDPRYLGGLLPEEVPRSFFGLDLSSPRAGYYTMLALLTAFTLATVGLRRSRFGRALIAVRTNPAAAESFGIDPRRLRLTAFAVAGSYAAVAGALLAASVGRVAPESFGTERSLLLFSFTVVGGLGGILGPMMGAAFLGALTIWSGNQLLHYMSAGIGGLLLLVAAPGGLADLVYRARDAILRRLAIRHRIPAGSLLGQRLAATLGEVAALRERAVGDRPVLPPLRYELPDQWALGTYGAQNGESARGAPTPGRRE